MLPDGSIDAHRADDLLAQSTIASREPPSELSEARVRKLRAQCALLQDEIEDLEKGLATPEEVALARRLAFDHVIGVLHSMLDELVPRLMGLEAVEASAIIQETVYKTLNELAKMNPFGECEPTVKQKHLKVEKLNGVQLEALKTSLQARRLEVQSSQRSGALVSLADVKTNVIARFINVRAKMLALHNRSAPQLVHVDAARAGEILSPMVAEMVEALVGR
ncbi:hypothetical protein LUX29_21535 [Aureimonas altamirensis]|uniref:hypothetical protein n=1 Tax=Aureimonas altamirensis TaxID=370622 RepID=UPI001E4AA995|nr:hypothetical protein [Aureimonas altamirensis]UHD45538.1 hypothetical protein LUX29_21535 [Aureimonas altamirensis]